MPVARALSLCDALAASIAAAWSPQEPSEVTRSYLGDVGEADLGTFDGRRVFVFPGPTEGFGENRGETRYEYEVGVIVMDRYAPPEGTADAPNSERVAAWLDECVSFVEEYVQDGLDFGSDGDFLTVGGRKVMTTSAAVTSLYDADLLGQHKVFRSDVAFTFQELLGE